MKNCIYYFTGSGNSLALSRSIADRLGNTKVLAIAQRLDRKDIADAERIGLVFPTYLWAVPRLVSEFAQCLRTNPDTYVFAVTVCSGTAGRVLYQLQRSLRSSGTRLRAGFIVRENEERFWPGRSDDERTMAMSKAMLRHPPATANERIEEIVDALRRKETRRPDRTNLVLSALMSPLIAISSETMLRKGDALFAVTDACTSCGTCVRVCPRHNVALDSGNPVWNHNCETCYACLMWCPAGAITYRGSFRREPAHHADVTLEDMLLR